MPACTGSDGRIIGWGGGIAGAVAVLLLTAAPKTVAAAPQEEVVRPDWGIAGFKPPPRWVVQPRDRQSYPQLLAWASRGDGAERAVITLVGKRLPAGTSLQAFANERQALKAWPRLANLRAQVQSGIGWSLGSGTGPRIQVDAQLTAGKGQRAQVVRQLYFMNPPLGYVLTLVAPAEQASARYRDLDDTEVALMPLPGSAVPAPVLPPPPVLPGPGPGPGPGSAAPGAAGAAAAGTGAAPAAGAGAGVRPAPAAPVPAARPPSPAAAGPSGPGIVGGSLDVGSPTEKPPSASAPK